MKVSKHEKLKLKKAIDNTRLILNELLENSSLDMTDEILQLSKELDILIVDYYLKEKTN